ncbi:immunoglobulin superfamily containing leucine-rich repeat protein-like [Pelodytes ibericus]
MKSRQVTSVEMSGSFGGCLYANITTCINMCTMCIRMHKNGSRIMGTFLILLVSLWGINMVLCNSCPASCNCVTNSAHPSADCSYRELHSVPTNLPFNLSQLSLSVNYISVLNMSSFAGTVLIRSLWLAYNKITTIEPGTFKGLSKLTSLDLSDNQLMDFPWSDLWDLHNLQILKLNNNQLLSLPSNTFRTSKRLRSLQLSNNKISSLPEGIFDPLTSLSHLQLFNNPFNCSCPLLWLKDWLNKPGITMDRKRDITCSSPSKWSGVSLEKLPDLQCKNPLEIQSDQPFLGKAFLLCKEAGDKHLISRNAKEIKVTINFFGNGSVMVTPIKQGIVYSCYETNHTASTTTLSHYKASGLLREHEGQLLLILVSGGRSEVKEGSHVWAVTLLCSLALMCY